MTPLKQRNLHRPDEGIWGDCHRAAIASILDKPLDDVPHFGDGGPDGEEFARRESDYLRTQGIVPIRVIYTDALPLVLTAVGKMNPGVCYLLGGQSRTGVDHTVVGLNDEIVHDPSINGSGIIGPCADGYYWVTFFGSAVAADRLHGDDAEPVDPDWLLSVGAKGFNDEHSTNVYEITINGSLLVRITLRFNRGEIESSSIGLSWTYRDISLAYGIDDNPTRGTVRRLCEALGAPLKEGGAA